MLSLPPLPTTFAGGETFGADASKTHAVGDGTVYLHVQAKDEAGNESVVASVQALMDNTAPTVQGLQNDSIERISKEWAWGCSESGCRYRFVINQVATPPNPMTGQWGDATMATQGRGEGTFYLHVQPQDEVGNEGPVASVSVNLSSTAFSVTGITGDLAPRRVKTWAWGCSENPCLYRWAVNQSETHSFGSTDVFGTTTTATQGSGDGTYYLHVQAQEAGNSNRLSSVTTVSAILDNTAPGVTGLVDDSTITASKNWTWGCDQAPCTYRYEINQSGHYVFTEADPPLAETDRVTLSRGTGEFHLHVQARDEAGNESPVQSVSVTLDNTDPLVVNFATSQSRTSQTNTWTWDCDDLSACTYRYAITQGTVSAFTFGTGDAFSTAATATQSSGDGDYYIYVQARDALGNSRDRHPKGLERLWTIPLRRSGRQGRIGSRGLWPMWRALWGSTFGLCRPMRAALSFAMPLIKALPTPLPLETPLGTMGPIRTSLCPITPTQVEPTTFTPRPGTRRATPPPW